MTTASVFLSLLLLLQAAPTPPSFTARLLTGHESLAPGGQTDLLVEIEVASPWHVYHPIVLDTGLATSVKFTTPPGVTIGDLRFPTPRFGKTAGFEYLELSGKIRAVAPLKIAADVAPGQTVTISAEVSGLACVEMCLPVRTTAALELPITPTQGQPVNAEGFKGARDRLAPALAKAPYIKGSALHVSKPDVGIDDPAELIATIRVQPGHHIQDRDPGVEVLIPSRLFVEKIAGIEFTEEEKQIWPAPHTRDLPGLGKVREQSGEVSVRVPFRIIDQEFPSGSVTVRVLFQYQACTDAGQCYPPGFAEGFVRFVADTPNAPASDAGPVAQGSPSPPEFDEPGAVMTDADAGEPTPAESGQSAPADAERGVSAETLASVIPPFTEEAWADGIPWQNWQLGLPEALSRAGRMAYVDFTAEWCPTCQTNKKLILETDTIRAKMRELYVVPLKADFTNPDPVMLAEINKHGHPTVPLNLVYAAGKPDKPGRLPALLTKDIVLRALENPLAFVGGAKSHLLAVLLAGFLGGLILNVMPCVLPVISIKILSFVQQAGEDPARVLRLGLAFCAGIMVWFWAFAVLSAQGNIPWQYPEVVIALGSIIFVFSLNLFGVFELVLPGAAAGTLDQLARREGYPGAFLKGVLATLLGTACTAPFLATALGYALTQPWWVGFAIFTAAGVGMSLPYVLLSAKPAWLKHIPKPGPWMVTFKQAAGFVLLATAVWLLWILAAQIDGRGVVWTVAFWGFLALAVWMLGRIKPTWRTGSRTTMWTASVAVAVFGLLFCYFWMYDWTERETGTAPAQTSLNEPAGVVPSPSEPPQQNAKLVRKDR